MVDARTSLPIDIALSTEVLEAQVLLRVRIVYDLALVKLARSGGKRQRVVIGACTASFVAAAAVVGRSRAGWVIIGIPVNF
jgi:hypothetical protein